MLVVAYELGEGGEVVDAGFGFGRDPAYGAGGYAGLFVVSIGFV